MHILTFSKKLPKFSVYFKPILAKILDLLHLNLSNDSGTSGFLLL